MLVEDFENHSKKFSTNSVVQLLLMICRILIKNGKILSVHLENMMVWLFSIQPRATLMYPSLLWRKNLIKRFFFNSYKRILNTWRNIADFDKASQVKKSNVENHGKKTVNFWKQIGSKIKLNAVKQRIMNPMMSTYISFLKSTLSTHFQNCSERVFLVLFFFQTLISQYFVNKCCNLLVSLGVVISSQLPLIQQLKWSISCWGSDGKRMKTFIYTKPLPSLMNLAKFLLTFFSGLKNFPPNAPFFVFLPFLLFLFRSAEQKFISWQWSMFT